jgi:hypothetical protein
VRGRPQGRSPLKTGLFILSFLFLCFSHLIGFGRELLTSSGRPAVPLSALGTDLVLVRPQVHRFQAALPSTSVFIRPSQSQNLKDIIRGTSERSIVGVEMRTSILPRFLNGESEIANSSSAPGTRVQGQDSRSRLLPFGLAGTAGQLLYGVNYRTAGTGFAESPDTALRELWGEWRLRRIRVKTTVAERWNNLEQDPRYPRLGGLQEKVALAITPPSGPEASLSYVHDARGSSLEPAGTARQRTIIDTLEAGLLYAQPRWKARVWTTYWQESDFSYENRDMVGFTQSISGSYQATEQLTVGPAVSLKEALRRWSGTRLETPAASLAMTYGPNPAVNLQTVGSVSKTWRSDGLMENSLSEVVSTLSWIYRQSSNFRSILSLHAAYRLDFAGAESSRSTEDLTGLVRLQITEL